MAKKNFDKCWRNREAKLEDNPLRKAIVMLRGQPRMAALMGVSQSSVSSWLARSKIPIEHALKIHHLTNGAVSYRQLRPDLDFGEPEVRYMAPPTEEELARTSKT